jgi:predicted kinase
MGERVESGSFPVYLEPMATAHLLFGFLGSGKTTLARELEERHRAIRFTPDEWMARLFGEDPDVAIFKEKQAIIFALLEPMWLRCLRLGVDVVLDYGFWSRAERDHVRELVISSGSQVLLYNVECSAEEAWRRVSARNRQAHRSLYIAPATFDLLKGRVEPLQSDESHLTARSKGC